MLNNMRHENRHPLHAPLQKIKLTILKVLVTALSLYWLISLTGFRTAWQTLPAIPVGAILLAAGMTLLAFLIGSIRWWVLLQHCAAPVSYPRILPSYYLGVFFNNILPTTMGGDAVRTAHLRLRGIELKTLVGSAIMDRGIGLFVVLGMGAISLGLPQEIVVAPRDRLLLVCAEVIMLTGVWLLFNSTFLSLIRRQATRYQHTRVRRFLLETWDVCHTYKTARGTLLLAAGLTVCMQSAVIECYYILGNSLGIALPIGVYFCIIPLVFLAGAVPISLGGIGVREGALVGLLIAVGVGTHLAVVLSLVYLAVLLATSLPGGLILLLPQASSP